MKKLIMTIATLFLFGFSSICNAAIIEMHFEDGDGGHQSLEFESDVRYSEHFPAGEVWYYMDEFTSTAGAHFNSYEKVYFGDVKIFKEDILFELITPELRQSYSKYDGKSYDHDYKYYDYYYSHKVGNNFRFQTNTQFLDPLYPWIQHQTNASIESESISYLGYDNITEMTPNLLEEIFDSMIGQLNFFNYDFSASQPNDSGLNCSSGDTTLTSWNYQTSPVPIPPTLWLLSSGLGLFSISRRKKL